MQYKIVTGNNTVNLSDNVNNEIKRGWMPQGGVLINGMMYAQAMVKKVKDDYVS
jgi:hypothetical protein